MAETYVAIGQEISPVIALMIPMMTMLGVAYRKAHGRTIELRWTEVLGCLAALPLPFFTITMEQGFMVLFMALGIGSVLDAFKEDKYPVWQRAVSCALIFAFAATTPYWFSTRFGGQLTLTDQYVAFEDFRGRKERVPRKGLEVRAMFGSSGWWHAKSTGSWTSYAQNGDLGPHVSGYELYRGPKGVIRGDDVGERLAQWAGTKPLYTRR